MFEGFSDFRIETEPNVSISGIKAGSGPPLLLLHGYPQTHHIWHLVAPQLTSEYTVIALDLRGYGASSKPGGSDSHAEYAKSVMARDCQTVMARLGHASYFVCAHDRGARVAHKLCVDHPASVRKVITLDICPTLAMYTKTNQTFATAYFHWFLLIQKAPFPETLIGQNPRLFAQQFMGSRYAGLKVFNADALEQYLKVLEQPDAIHAMCEDYRASASVDLDEARADLAAGRRIKAPLRALWGAHGVIEKCLDALKEWREVSDAEVTGQSVDCGHYIPEEKPDVVLQHIKEFLV
ncbi:MAG: hypothetical protein M1818_007957 [Claussenomyces sp. TS43310]|nr:MAG: hypothetical protein M1818_007957 [Claussenomyces sp. TS43310]